jgi:transposase-like protein
MWHDKQKNRLLVDDGTPVAWHPDDGRRFTCEQIAQAQGKGVIKHSAPCPHCKGRNFIVEPGKGPHAQHLRCVECRRGGMWLSKTQSHELNGWRDQ